MFIWLRTLNKFRLKRKLKDNNNKRCICIRSSKRNSLLLWIWGYEPSFIFGSINFYNNCNCQFLTNHKIKNQDVVLKSATQFQNKKKKECIGKIYRKETKKKGRCCNLLFVNCYLVRHSDRCTVALTYIRQSKLRQWLGFSH